MIRGLPCLLALVALAACGSDSDTSPAPAPTGPALLRAGDAPGCIDIALEPERVRSVDVITIPAGQRAVHIERRLSPGEGGDRVSFQAIDQRLLPMERPRPEVPGIEDITPVPFTAPVRWEGTVDGRLATDLLEATGSGVRCLGESQGGAGGDLRARVDVAGGYGDPRFSLVQRAPGRWSLGHSEHRGRFWRLEDAGLEVAIEALVAASMAEGGEEAWRRVDGRCPPPIGDAALSSAVFEYEWTGMRQRRGDRWTWTRTGNRWSGERGIDPPRPVGPVSGHLFDALLAAAAEEVTCQQDDYTLRVRTDDYPKWRLELTLSDGRELVLSSSSNTADWQPWLVSVDDYAGVQETGAIGRALRAILDAGEDP